MKDTNGHVKVSLTPEGRKALDDQGLEIKPFLPKDLKEFAVKTANSNYQGKGLRAHNTWREKHGYCPVFEPK